MFVVVFAAAGPTASEASPPGLEWDEVAGIPEPEHLGGNDAGVST